MQNFSRYLFIGIIIALIGFVVWQLKTIVIYISIAIVISLIGEPLVNLYSKVKLKNFKFSQGVCAGLALVTLSAILVLFISIFIPLIIKEARIISEINPNEVVSAFNEPLKSIEHSIKKFNINYENAPSIETFITKQLSSIFGFNEVSSLAQGIFGFTTRLIGATFVILFMSFFFLKDKHTIKNVILLLTPNKHMETVEFILSDSKKLLTKYFLGILLDMCFVATLTFIGLSIIGIENALLIGVFAGLINIIPYIGPIIGVSFGVLIGITTNLQLDFYTQLFPLIGKIAFVFMIIQIIDGFFFQPLVISNIVKAHPLEIFLVIIIAGTFAGIGGMVIAVPVYTILRIIAREFLNNFKFIQKLTEDLDED